MSKADEGYYKIVKLKTGETILCTMDADVKSISSTSYLLINEPVQVIPHKETRKGRHIVGESFLMRPWIGLSDSEEFTVSVDVVMTIGNIKSEVKRQYVDYLTQASHTRDAILRSEAVDDLFREMSNGELNIVDVDYDPVYEDDNNESEERK
jgi:hypothetical protein